MGRRVGLLLAAVVVGLLGTSSVFAYVGQVEDRAQAGQELVEVLVADDRIAAGTTGGTLERERLVVRRSLPRKAVPEGALTSLSSVRSQSLSADVYPGELLLAPKFAESVARTGSLVIPPGKLALSVELGDPQRVAGFVVPGSEVAIFNTMDKASGRAVVTAKQTGAATTSVDVDAAADASETRLLLARVPVIAVGPTTLREGEDDSNDEKVAKAVLTVAVTQTEAEKLVHAATRGEVYFGLLSTSSKTGGSQGVTDTTLYG